MLSNTAPPFLPFLMKVLMSAKFAISRNLQFYITKSKSALT